MAIAKLSDWRSYFGYYQDRAVEAVVNAKPPPIEDRAAILADINAYLGTRGDLLPMCKTCNKRVGNIEINAQYTSHNFNVRFRCHGAYVDQVIPRHVLSSQDQIYSYLQGLASKELFKPVPPKVTSQVNLGGGDSLSIIYNTTVGSGNYLSMPSAVSSVMTWPGPTWQGLPARKVVPPPKTPPKFAPLLPTEPVKRAIMLDD